MASNPELSKVSLDQRLRWPTVHFFLAAGKWLIVASLFGLISSIQDINPSFLAGFEWLTYGKTKAVFMNSLIYGWGFNAAFGVVLWMMARLCGSVACKCNILFVGGVFWQLGLIVGVVGILIGDMTSVLWLEMPTYAAGILLVSYTVMGTWGIITFLHRLTRNVYIAQCYFLGALFWFPWLYTVAQMMLFWWPVRGTLQPLLNWWYVQGVIGMWFAPIAVGAAYYLIPKILGKKILHYNYAIAAFWLWALFSSWAGMSDLAGSPVPAWIVTSGIIASVLLLVPIVIISVNLHGVSIFNLGKIRKNPSLRFIVFSSVFFSILGLLSALISLRTVSSVLRFTYFTEGYFYHALLGFYTMAMFGSIYFVLPQLLDRKWSSNSLLGFHYWVSGGGISVVLISLYLGGWLQGIQVSSLNEEGVASYSISEISRFASTWLFLKLIGIAAFVLGNFVFVFNLMSMLLSYLGDGVLKQFQFEIDMEPFKEKAARILYGTRYDRQI
ncbi:MAG: Cbb3-type cytochrome c oxidase subunit CcoN1 [Candidatus Moanabacter tarae]|uniref:Cbb3-type cytochrome c oxidase subunit CcoN1 n=1 Tax=Candidatus Moanibacter tarae TaxID=2200854 RepID=A0A2Z4ADV7_9BACT|nr:MAG: Cbb3-type cytochrome c oxidase subunit CcoN1 [Candidatus Moanabacter tarae]|tara:strand:+ start:5425 stop:6915 length:1491 start_codon:yes stop_codon:yes gene_type:complete